MYLCLVHLITHRPHHYITHRFHPPLHDGICNDVRKSPVCKSGDPHAQSRAWKSLPPASRGETDPWVGACAQRAGSGNLQTKRNVALAIAPGPSCSPLRRCLGVTAELMLWAVAAKWFPGLRDADTRTNRCHAPADRTRSRRCLCRWVPSGPWAHTDT